MAFDPAEHVIDPLTGLMVHKDSGRVAGLTQPHADPVEHREFPKFVEPHPSHVVFEERTGRRLVPQWPNHFIDRDGKLSVLVSDEDEEIRAVSVAE